MSAEPRPEDFTVTVRDENLPRSEIVEVLLKLSSKKLTARDLIAERVQAECDDVDGSWVSYLVQPNADETKLNGEIRQSARNVDSTAPIADALSAFEANVFILLVDDDQIEELTQEITMTPSTVVTFLKLTPLVGG